MFINVCFKFYRGIFISELSMNRSFKKGYNKTEALNHEIYKLMKGHTLRQNSNAIPKLPVLFTNIEPF